MKKTFAIYSICLLLVMGFGLFVSPSKADASCYSCQSYHRSYYDIPSYSTDYPGYHGYRNSTYVVDNSYITPKSYNSYQATYPKSNNTYNYNYNYNYNFYNTPVYQTNDVVYPRQNYNTNYNFNRNTYAYDNYNDNYDYNNNNGSCYGYGC